MQTAKDAQVTVHAPPMSSSALRLPPTSLIICSRNRHSLLNDTVASILKGDVVPTELIIVDQSDAADPALSRLATERNCEVRYLWSPTVGTSRARNTGIAAARHLILAFIDDDMLVTPKWFDALITALTRAGERSAVTGQVRAMAEKPGGFQLTLVTEEKQVAYGGRINKDVLRTGNMALYRSAIEDVGYFDTRLGPGARFPSAEDNDYGFRLLEAGYRVLYVPEALIYHRTWRTLRDYLPLNWRYGRGQGAYYAKHVRLRDWHMLRRALQDIRRYIRLLPGRLWRGQRLILAGNTFFILGICWGATEWLLTQPKRSALR
jgi:GT2 family glycosyltransferase